jgi:adenosylcobyric acid synthase
MAARTIMIQGTASNVGKSVEDPDAVKFGGEMEGLGLPPVVTVFEREKVRTRVQGTVASVTGLLEGVSGMEIEGYKVHMGNTVSEGAKPLPALLEISDTNTGTYNRMDASWTAYTAPDAGPETNFRACKERQYDTLANLLRGSIDIKKFYSILEEGLGWAV